MGPAPRDAHGFGGEALKHPSRHSASVVGQAVLVFVAVVDVVWGERLPAHVGFRNAFLPAREECVLLWTEGLPCCNAAVWGGDEKSHSETAEFPWAKSSRVHIGFLRGLRRRDAMPLPHTRATLCHHHLVAVGRDGEDQEKSVSRSAVLLR